KSGTSASFVIANKSDETKEAAAYTVSAPATTITNSNGNVSLVTNNGQSVNNTISSPQGFTVSVDWNGGNSWFTIGNNFNAGSQTVKATLVNNLSNVTIKTATVTLTNKIAGGQNLTYTVAPNFQTPVVTMISNTANRLEGTTVSMIKNTSNSNLNSTITLRAKAIGGTQIGVTGGLSVTPVTTSTALETDYMVKVAYNASQSSGTITFYNKSNTAKQTKLNVTIKNNTVVYPPTNEPAIELTKFWVAPSIFTGPHSATKNCPEGWFVPDHYHFGDMVDDGAEKVAAVYCPDGQYWFANTGKSGGKYVADWPGWVSAYINGTPGWSQDSNNILNIRCIKTK
ncbi:hypothetical protein AALM74_27105, partial [Parabacteroides segnis]|uniref:hypothetical protein n=1 Tax=Parabacteroides segnis TaxID=2763058 RepID=UPI00351773C0